MTCLSESYNETVLKFLKQLVDGQPKTAEVSNRFEQLQAWLSGSDASGNKNSASAHLATTFYKQVSPYIESVKAREFEPLCGSKLLTDFGISEFLKYLDPGDKDRFGGWVEGLCSNAEMIAAGGSQQAKLAAYAEELVLEMDRQQNFDNMKPEDVPFAITSGILNNPAAGATVIQMLLQATEQDQENLTKWAGPMLSKLQNVDVSVSEAELRRTLGTLPPSASLAEPQPAAEQQRPTPAAEQPLPQPVAAERPTPVAERPTAVAERPTPTAAEQQRPAAAEQQRVEEDEQCLQPLPVDDDNRPPPPPQNSSLLLLPAGVTPAQSPLQMSGGGPACASTPQQHTTPPPTQFMYGDPQQFGNPRLPFPMPLTSRPEQQFQAQPQQFQAQPQQFQAQPQQFQAHPQQFQAHPQQFQAHPQQPQAQQQHQQHAQRQQAPQEAKSRGDAPVDFLQMLGGLNGGGSSLAQFHLNQPTRQPSIQSALLGAPRAAAITAVSAPSSPFGAALATATPFASASTLSAQKPIAAASGNNALGPVNGSQAAAQAVSPFGVSLGNSALSPQATKDKIREISEKQQQRMTMPQVNTFSSFPAPTTTPLTAATTAAAAADFQRMFAPPPQMHQQQQRMTMPTNNTFLQSAPPTGTTTPVAAAVAGAFGVTEAEAQRMSYLVPQEHQQDQQLALMLAKMGVAKQDASREFSLLQQKNTRADEQLASLFGKPVTTVLPGQSASATTSVHQMPASASDVVAGTFAFLQRNRNADEQLASLAGKPMATVLPGQSASEERSGNHLQASAAAPSSGPVVGLPTFLSEVSVPEKRLGNSIPGGEGKDDTRDLFATASAQPGSARGQTPGGGGGRGAFAQRPQPFGGGGGGVFPPDGAHMPDLSSMMSTMMSNPVLMQSLSAAMMGQAPPTPVPAGLARDSAHIPDLSTMMTTMMSNPVLMQSLSSAMMGQAPPGPPFVTAGIQAAAAPTRPPPPVPGAVSALPPAPAPSTMPSYEVLLQEWQAKQPPAPHS